MAKKASSEGTKARATPYTAAASVPSFKRRTFDARPDRMDFRDLPYRPPLRSLPSRWPTDAMMRKVVPTYIKENLILDQGTEGACTGFGLACVINYLLWVRYVTREDGRKFARVSPRMLYELARQYDEWPGEEYDWSSCRGALKGWHKHGVCSDALWRYPFDRRGSAVFEPPRKGWEKDALQRTLGVYYRVERTSVVDIQAAIVNIGAVYASAEVHQGWDDLLRAKPSKVPRVHKDVPTIELPAEPGDVGGHAFAIVGYDDCGFIVQNSWGRRWGAHGFARLPYSDWVAHASDAWACALGVPAEPTDVRIANARFRASEGKATVVVRRVAVSALRNPPEDPWPVDHPFANPAYEPLRTSGAYARSLVAGNDGELCIRDVTVGGPTGVDRYVADVAMARPFDWFRQTPAGPCKLAIYAHGGLNDEDGAIQRTRVLAPYFLANGIYPLFLVWRTGFGETICSLIGDWFRRTPGADEALAGGFFSWLGEQKDRALELVARRLGRGIWGEMRENAARGVKRGHGLDLLSTALADLATSVEEEGRSLEIHLVGHSAGAIQLGHLLESIQKKSLTNLLGPIGSCTLLAPACSVRFANERFVTASEEGLLPLKHLWLDVLSDDNEKSDGLPNPTVEIYGKSLLYLVSHALDDERHMPILGLERVHSADSVKSWTRDHRDDVKRWQAQWAGSGGDERLTVEKRKTVRFRRDDGDTRATHGSFDNNIDVLTKTIERMKGGPLVSEMEWLDY